MKPARWRKVACPTCGAQPGRPCRTWFYIGAKDDPYPVAAIRGHATGPHKARREALRG